MQPRIYTYKITFEEIPHWYWGVHKEKKFGELYWGSPITNKWFWDFYTPKIQILEFFPFTDEGWKEANLVEDRLIKPDLNNPLCLNEGCGARVSREAAQRGGFKMKGVPKTEEHKKKIGQGNRGKKRSPEYCKALSERNKGRVLTPEQKAQRSASMRQFYQENPEARQKKSEEGSQRKWYHNPATGETCHREEAPSPEWDEGRPIDYLGAPWWTNGKENKRSFEKPGPEWGRGVNNHPSKRRFQCTITGFISSSGGLTKYQKSRGIDPSNRVLVE